MTVSSLPGMGWLPDIPSISDYTEGHPEVAPLLTRTRLNTGPLSAPAPAQAASGGTAAAAALETETTVDLRAHCSPIEDQGRLGSCTAHAAVGLVEYFQTRSNGKFVDASRLFVYKTTRNLLGWKGDTGAYIRTTMGALVLFGAPPERYWPYDVSEQAFDAEPTPFCYAFGASYRAIKYLRLDPPGVAGPALLQTVKNYLAAGLPSMFGFPVYDEFMSPNSQGQVAYPRPDSRNYGGHAIMAVGYDDNLTIGADRGALLIRNSWGTGWGQGGYAWMSYRYTTAGLAMDWWTMINAAWVDSGQFA